MSLKWEGKPSEQTVKFPIRKNIYSSYKGKGSEKYRVKRK